IQLARAGIHEFSYEEGSPSGPKKWGTLSAECKSCSDGESQSPVNIEVKKAKDQPNDLKRSYKEAPAKLVNRGYTIMVEWQADAGGIEVNGSTYKLVQCHWHTPAEHTIDGERQLIRYDAEIHFVHSNDKDQKAVIGVLYTIGEPDPFIQNLSESKFKEIGTNGNDLGKVSASSSTSGSKKYYRYRGSLTTPPCSEGVTWTIAETIKSISKDQIELLKGPLDPEFKENARPVQELTGRTVTQFEDKEIAMFFKLDSLFFSRGFFKQTQKSESDSLLDSYKADLEIQIHEILAAKERALNYTNKEVVFEMLQVNETEHKNIPKNKAKHDNAIGMDSYKGWEAISRFKKNSNHLFNSITMSNLNLSSLLFICLMIISSRSFISICTANECNDVGLRQQLVFGTATNDMPQTTFDRRKILEIAEGGPKFNYLEGTHLGPKNWGTITPEWKICNDGKSQSPINIENNRVQVTPSDLKRAYLDAPATIINGINNIGVRWTGDGGGIEVNGSIYKLTQCHWHTPSEHTVDGKGFDAELHLVHKSAMGRLAVVGMLYNIGLPDPFITSVKPQPQLTTP
ncbi:hypothetical protein M8C21_026005, partial [Ambrosia artemisiifolia]